MQFLLLRRGTSVARSPVGSIPDTSTGEPMMHRAKLLGAVAVLIAVVTTQADDKKADKPFDDAEFVKMTASGGLQEVELGKLAATRAKADDVKMFARRLVEDHTKANDELKKAASSAGFSIPDKMNEEHQKHFDKFREMTGDAFDKEFIKHMIKDHEEDVKSFTRATTEAKNPMIKEFATKTLPTLKEHLDMVKKLHDAHK
jgi:putative membrane protein